MWVLVRTFVLAGAVACIVITAKATQQAGTESANGLRMSLAHDEGASGPGDGYALHRDIQQSKE